MSTGTKVRILLCQAVIKTLRKTVSFVAGQPAAVANGWRAGDGTVVWCGFENTV